MGFTINKLQRQDMAHEVEAKYTDFSAALESFACKLRMHFDNGLVDAYQAAAASQNSGDLVQQIFAYMERQPSRGTHGELAKIQGVAALMQEYARQGFEVDRTLSSSLAGIAKSFQAFTALKQNIGAMNQSYAQQLNQLRGSASDEGSLAGIDAPLKRHCIDTMLDAIAPDFMQGNTAADGSKPSILDGRTDVRSQLVSAVAQVNNGQAHAAAALVDASEKAFIASVRAHAGLQAGPGK